MAAMEFTPEINEDFYGRLAGRIARRTDAGVGQARGEALARGRQGDAFETSAVGMARGRGAEELNDLDAELAYKLAGMQREERLTKEGQVFQAGESQKDREAEEREREFNWLRYGGQAADAAKTANRRAYQGALWSAGASAAGNVIGRGIGSMF